jgi:OPT oligopeptide transporter protein
LSFWRYINFPVFFASVGYVSQGSALTLSSWAVVGFIFNYYIRRYHFRWWMRHNYILSAALDAGVGLSIILVFFTVQYPKGGSEIKWWGNTGKSEIRPQQSQPLNKIKYSLDEHCGRQGHSTLQHETWREIRTNDVDLKSFPSPFLSYDVHPFCEHLK